MNRLYGWRFNPLYQSGTIATVLLAVVTVTGIYLLLFYRIGSPHESVARITGQTWVGLWMRGLHRYASDGAVIAVAVHAFRMFAQGRSWGARSLAWVSGLVLLFLLLVCGWTGYVMVWDVQAQILAVEGARLLDALPIFAEPISRTFVGEAPIPAAFFFLNLFLHIVLPVAMGLGLWIHVSRLARPQLAPPRELTVGIVGLLLAVSLVWPVTMAPRADLLSVPGRVPLDFLYGFWVPFTRALPAGWALATVGAVTVGVILAPLWTRPARRRRPPPSVVDGRVCTGCEQCYLDCPYEAIAMVDRFDSRADRVARVDPSLCVGCGICAGSCAPMGVGPAGRTGRDQLASLGSFVANADPMAGQVVVIACDRGVGDPGLEDRFTGIRLHRVGCVGNLHTSSIEFFLRDGAAGVIVLSCPPRDCWNREGPEWARQRMFEDREAELQRRVTKDRVRLEFLARGEVAQALSEIERFRDSLAAVARGSQDLSTELIRECDPLEEKVTG